MEAEDSASNMESTSRLRDTLLKLSDENVKLKAMLDLSNDKIRHLLKNQSRVESLEKLLEERANEVHSYKQQLLRLLSTRTEGVVAETSSSSDHINVDLHATAAKLLQDNLKLRKELVGVTPDRSADRSFAHCNQCTTLRRQKDRQALYFEKKLLHHRKLERKYQLTLKVLEEHVQELKKMMDQMEKTYQVSYYN
ncbi:unnamed protein product [Soboliphyme baturini]|uniref:Cerebellar degeneration-related protein 2-like n=1 Tax=Soboliphyme baturini TaxID=241478 RepID=A0A183J470_9BILA|nr:unnamed protein product [Soboliphyme baturini]